MKQTERKASTRGSILDAAMETIRTKGFNATTVDDVCVAAGVTKGAFFHHFPSKDAMGEASAQHFSDMADQLFANAPYQTIEDPLERFLGYIDFRQMIVQGEIPQVTCLLGTLVQEVYETHLSIRQACERHIWGHANQLVPMISEAKERYAPEATWTPESMAIFTQTVLQGAFILTKAAHNTAIAVESIDHLKAYVRMSFNCTPN